jgi:hypothetical protein
MIVRLTLVQARPNYRLYVELADGRSGEIDLTSELWGPMFDPLRDPAVFAQVTLDEIGIPTWPNGADLAPEFLEEKLALASPPRRPPG